MSILATDLSTVDKANVRAALLTWRAEGVENPLIPLDVDIDGDGIADAFGLDENDEVVIVLGKPLAETVFESEGGGTETKAPILEEDNG